MILLKHEYSWIGSNGWKIAKFKKLKNTKFLKSFIFLLFNNYYRSKLAIVAKISHDMQFYIFYKTDMFRIPFSAESYFKLETYKMT